MGMGFIFKSSNAIAFSATKRKGIVEKKLILPEESVYQNIILVKSDPGSEVELHKISNSESFFVLKGTYEIVFPNYAENIFLKEGDICYFNPETYHGLRCIDGPGQIYVVFSPSKLINQSDKPDEWQKILYAEAWKQYCHEDTLCQHRNTLYFGIQGALITLFSVLLKTNTDFGYYFIIGILLCVISFLGIRISYFWEYVTRAGKAYCNLRWAAIRKIEKEAALSSFNIASLEGDWKDFSEQSYDDFIPFPEDTELNKIRILSYKRVLGGWSSTSSLIMIFKLLWAVFLVIGIYFLIMDFLTFHH